MVRMTNIRKFKAPVAAILAAGVLAGAGTMLVRAQGLNDLSPQMAVSDPLCVYFGAQQAQYVNHNTMPLPNGGRAGVEERTGRYGLASARAAGLSDLTSQVASQLPPVPGGTRTGWAVAASRLGLIDQYLFSAMEAAGVEPAATTTDWEFYRRVSLDLTGRIPTPSAILAFVNDTTPNKRAAAVDVMLASPEWIDKWTMFFGDLFKNNSSNTQIQRFRPGVSAFYSYIKDSLAGNKPYDQMTREMISAAGDTSYTTGEINFTVGGVVTGGPAQDISDQQTVNIADTFLGIAHMNCLLCHNGAGHLTNLSLWGQQQARESAWGMSAFLSHTYTFSTAVSSASVDPRFWTVTDNSPRAATDYKLNTTTGNRPARQPIGLTTAIAPKYMFTGETPKPGENYRAAMARMITADPQFARATVNYMWAYFFGVGLVDPPDQFDPLRLDPDNPPPAPWTLQPSNPRLLNALAQAFIANKFDLKWLTRQIVNSGGYQLSSRYDGTWNPAWSTLYARKNVRRLWGEEIHDAIAISSQNVPVYSVNTYGTISYAMQFPEPVAVPDGANGNITGFLDAFLRGNRDDQPRSGDGSILQALNLMNDSFVMTRTSPKTPATGLLPANIGQPNSTLVNTLFLNVLSRYPTAQEMSVALGNLANTTTRTQEAQNLLWSLYNKVDFNFNY